MIMRRFVCFILLALASAGFGYAGTITFVSGDSTNEGNCAPAEFPCASPGINLPASSDPLWYSPVAGAWVTHSSTAPAASSAEPARSFYETFMLPSAAIGGTVRLWADDTAAVWLIGPGGTVSIVSANLAVDGGCAAGAIGCETGENLTIDAAAYMTAAGMYTLRIDAYQLFDSTPFGVLYDGAIDYANGGSIDIVPEPGTFTLLCIGSLFLVLVPLYRYIQTRKYIAFAGVVLYDSRREHNRTCEN